ncbi:SH3 domain-containing protein [Aureimonas mangrovi]|uniref:SH3 domain-containing protein n=1 Tax=Aureimonas mangrovi TaxID=2758041 RepID=UPI00163D628D|nr:SH3 domain-containing protein [Aureimonas mangrovi]
MSQRKPRRNAPARKAPARRKATRQPVSFVWWVLGAAAVGWIAYDANRDFVDRHAPMLTAALPWSAPEPARQAARQPEPQRAAAERPAPSAPRQTEASRAAPRPPAPVAPASTATREAPVRTAAMTPVRPEQRPARQAATNRTGAPTTARRAPMRRAPEADAPVWVTLEAGVPLRISERKGNWRRVEAGIFTGWIEAEAIASAAPAAAAAPTAERRQAAQRPQPASSRLALPSVTRKTNDGDAPVPRGAIPTAAR